MMNTTEWNELAEAYDEKFDVLERARIAYCDAINATLATIDGRVGERCRCGAGDKQVAASSSYPTPEPADHPAASLRKVLAYEILGPGGSPHARIMVRFSSPWEAQAGFLQIALVSTIDRRWREDLRQWAEEDWAKHESIGVEALAIADQADEWIHAITIRVSDPDVVSRSSETVWRLIHLARGILARLETERIEYRMQCVFETCRRQLKTEHKLATLFHFPLAREWGDVFGNQWYLQITKQPGFWVAYEWERRSLMFGHNPDKQDPEGFQRKLQIELQEIGGGSWESYPADGVYRPPGGTLIEPESLIGLKIEEIAGVAMNAFKAFLRIVAHDSKAAGENRLKT
jgi:hypothetical protein